MLDDQKADLHALVRIDAVKTMLVTASSAAEHRLRPPVRSLSPLWRTVHNSPTEFDR